MDTMSGWVLFKLILGMMVALAGLYHWIKLDRGDDAAYHAGNAVMFTLISYNLLEV